MKNSGDLHKGHRQRLKQRAQHLGLENLPYHEVLELVLTYSIPHKDVNPLAHRLIDSFGSLAGVFDAGYEQLKGFDGIGHETALYLSLFPQLINCYNASRNNQTIILGNVKACVRHFREVTNVKNHEEFYVFCLDAKKKLIKTIKMDNGTPSSITISITALVERLAGSGAKSVVIMHVHPGDNVLPTNADVEATRRIISVCYTLGVAVEDHIIVSDTSYYSFSHNSLFDSLVKDVAEKLNSVVGINADKYVNAARYNKKDE